MRLCQARFRLDIRKRFFPDRLIGHWSILPGKVVIAPNVSEFKQSLGSTWRIHR